MIDKNKKKKKEDQDKKEQELIKEQRRQAKVNSETWYLSGKYNPAFPGGGSRHPLDMD